MDILSCVVLVSLLVEVSSVPPQGSPLECYCTTGNGCIDNSCGNSDGDTTFSAGLCAVQVDPTQERTSYYCLGPFVTCSPFPDASLIQCCATDLCNKCLIPEDLPPELAIKLTLPPGCPPLNITVSPTGQGAVTTPQVGDGSGDEDVSVLFIVIIAIIVLLILVVVGIVVGLVIHVKRYGFRFGLR